MNQDQFMDYIDEVCSGASIAKNEQCLGSLVHIEITLNLRKTKTFTDTPEAYKDAIKKLLLYYAAEGLFVDHEETFIEYGGLNKKCHSHSSIYIITKGPYNPCGLVEQTARFFCSLFRRNYDEKCEYYKYKKYWSVPITIQITSEYRSKEWNEYIRKNAFNLLK